MFSSNATQVSSAANYIEDVFSTYLYTGTGSTQTITNGIDLSTYGGMVWLKARTSGGSSFTNHAIIDTVRGKNANGYYSIYPNLTEAQFSPTGSGDAVATAVSATGFTVGGNANVNYNTQTDVSWTFRKQAKFFDVVTYTGNGTSSKAVSHNLGSVPGCMIVKKTSASGTDWSVYHRSLGNGGLLLLNDTVAAFTSNSEWAFTTPTSTEFYVNGVGGDSNANGATYVAYLFAHNAGGFGLTGTDNVISCGSFTTNGSGAATVSLGYEPQMLIVKRTDAAEDWFMVDNMRGWFASPSVDTATLKPNTSGAEFTWGAVFAPSATGFTYNYNPSSTYIYIAIRRGPMKVPTSGTSVFSPYVTTSITLAQAGSNGGGGATSTFSANFPVDFVIEKDKSAVEDWYSGARLTGTNYLLTNSTAAQATSAGFFWDSNKAMGYYNSSYGLYEFRRAPSFFDVVCYTGNGSTQNISHNLGVVPEMMIAKRRDVAGSWVVYTTTTGNSAILELSSTGAVQTSAPQWNSTTPTASVFSLGTSSSANASGSTYVWYGFATCAGVSKVGSYTGTGTTKQVDCGFTGGARFVLIKRTDSTGDWYVWDSARGIVAGNDPYLLLNSTAAEVTNTDYVDTYSAGFEISSTAPAAINASGGTFIFLAIA